MIYRLADDNMCSTDERIAHWEKNKNKNNCYEIPVHVINFKKFVNLPKRLVAFPFQNAKKGV